MRQDFAEKPGKLKPYALLANATIRQAVQDYEDANKMIERNITKIKEVLANDIQTTRELSRTQTLLRNIDSANALKREVLAWFGNDGHAWLNTDIPGAKIIDYLVKQDAPTYAELRAKMRKEKIKSLDLADLLGLKESDIEDRFACRKPWSIWEMYAILWKLNLTPQQKQSMLRVYFPENPSETKRVRELCAAAIAWEESGKGAKKERKE